MKIVTKYGVPTIIFIAMAVAVILRLYLYGDPRLSMGMGDTASYINSAQAPLLSWQSFVGQRLFTTNLVYKLATNSQKCKLTATSYPVTPGELLKREAQPCFDKIALLQNLLSIIGWCFLAWTTSRWLKSPFAKIASVVLILAFAFTPQIAEWDSVLSSESLSLSLFAIALALLLEITFRIYYKNEPLNSIKNMALIFGWMLVLAFWIFVRDVHLYAVPITIILLSILLLTKKYRQTKVPVLMISVLFIIFVLGYVSAKDSLRATGPLEDAFNAYVFPFPPRVQFFRNSGMPGPQSPGFQKWFDSQAAETYGLFLTVHPRFVVSAMFDESDFFQSDFTQPYYISNNEAVRNILIGIGKFIHLESNTVYLLDALLLISLGIASFKRRDPWIISWTWLAFWIFLCASISLFVDFFGDSGGALRHIFIPVETFRLSIWIFLMIHVDYLLEK